MATLNAHALSPPRANIAIRRKRARAHQMPTKNNRKSHPSHNAPADTTATTPPSTMPALTISTNAAAAGASSPPRPPMSPITPSHSPTHPGPPPPTHLDLNDASNDGQSTAAAATAASPPPPPPPRFTHSTHPDQVPSIPAPPPQPLDFEDNVDVIALKSVISTLQMQSRRAEKDIRTLRDVKAEALQRPEDFARHIAGMAAEPKGGGGASAGGGEGGVEWPKLPERISVARCPPINWSQYAVNGQALDALHNEQVARPNQGAPATFSDGVYSHSAGGGRQDEYLGPTAPYDPQRDKLEKKSKGRK